MEAVYSAWLIFIMMVLPVSLPLVLPIFVARRLHRMFPKWPLMTRYSFSYLFVSLGMMACLQMMATLGMYLSK